MQLRGCVGCLPVCLIWGKDHASIADPGCRPARRISCHAGPARTVSLSELGFIAEHRGDAAAARSWHIQGLTAAQALGDPQAVAEALTGLAGAHALGGQPDRAARLLGAADAAWHPPGASHPPGAGADVSADPDSDVRRITAATRQALGEAAFAAGFEDGRRLSPRQAASLLRRGLPTGRTC